MYKTIVYGRRTIKENKSSKNSLDKKLAEIREYNKIHGTHLSYGQYSVLFRHK